MTREDWDGHIHHWPPPAIRVKLWEREDPAELRRAADEWEALGYRRYAEYLRTWARGERPAFMRAPW